MMFRALLFFLTWMICSSSEIYAASPQSPVQAPDATALKQSQEECQKLIKILRTRYGGSTTATSTKTILGECFLVNKQYRISVATNKMLGWFFRVESTEDEKLSTLRQNIEKALIKVTNSEVLSSIDVNALEALNDAVQTFLDETRYTQEINALIQNPAERNMYKLDWLKTTTASVVNPAFPIQQNQAYLKSERTKQTVKMLPQYLYSMNSEALRDLLLFANRERNTTTTDQFVAALQTQALLLAGKTPNIQQLAFLKQHPSFPTLVQLIETSKARNLDKEIQNKTFDMLDVFDALDALLTAFTYERDAHKKVSREDLADLCTEVEDIINTIKVICMKLFMVKNQKFDECEYIIRKHDNNMRRLHRSHMLFKEKDEVWILSLDGGGTRGLYGATLLQALEQQTGISVAHFFDFFAGTSTGGLMSLLLTAPRDVTSLEPAYTTQNLVDLYINESKNIFPPLGTAAAVSSTLWYGHKYSPAFLEKMMNKFFDIKRFSLAYKPTLVVSVDDVERKIIPFVSYHPFEEADQQSGDISINNMKDPYFWQVGRSTSAAPTYFPPMIMQYDGLMRSMIDGGMAQNNPAFEALKEVIRMCPQVKTIHIVSVGTGKANKKRSLSNLGSGIGASLGAVIESQMECSAQSAENNIESIKNSLRNQQGGVIKLEHYRIQPELYDDIDLADSTPASQSHLQYLARMTYSDDSYRQTESQKNIEKSRDYNQQKQAMPLDFLRNLYAFDHTQKAHENFVKVASAINQSPRKAYLSQQTAKLQELNNQGVQNIQQQKEFMLDQAQARFVLSNIHTLMQKDIQSPEMKQYFESLQHLTNAGKINSHWLLDSFLLICYMKDIPLRDMEALQQQIVPATSPLPKGMQLVGRLQHILQSLQFLSDDPATSPTIGKAKTKIATILLTILFGYDQDVRVNILMQAQTSDTTLIAQTLITCAISMMETNPNGLNELTQLTRIEQSTSLSPQHQAIYRSIILQAARHYLYQVTQAIPDDLNQEIQALPALPQAIQDILANSF